MGPCFASRTSVSSAHVDCLPTTNLSFTRSPPQYTLSPQHNLPLHPQSCPTTGPTPRGTELVSERRFQTTRTAHLQKHSMMWALRRVAEGQKELDPRLSPRPLYTAVASASRLGSASFEPEIRVMPLANGGVVGESTKSGSSRSTVP